jgi:hypothetical protein
MVDRRIKPYHEQLAEEQRREEQRRAFRRNQVFGLLLIAAAIVIWRLFHTNPKWIFPPGWWRQNLSSSPLCKTLLSPLFSGTKNIRRTCRLIPAEAHNRIMFPAERLLTPCALLSSCAPGSASLPTPSPPVLLRFLFVVLS